MPSTMKPSKESIRDDHTATESESGVSEEVLIDIEFVAGEVVERGGKDLECGDSAGSQCDDASAFLGGDDNDGALPHLIMLLAIVFVALLGVFQCVIIGASVQQRRNEAGLELAFLDLVPPETASALEDPASPQSKALFWISSDPEVMNYSLERSLQRFNLAVLYYALSGPKWNTNVSWLDPRAHECQWFNQASHGGAEPSCSGDVLQRLDLSYNNLEGTIPFELGQLTSLTFLDLSGNSELSGEVPRQMCAEASVLRLEVKVDCSSIKCC